MKRFLILSIVLFAAIANGGQQREDYPGQSHHGEPPAGWVCSNHPNAPKGHKCGCNPACTKGDDGKITIAEDPKCSVYCWKEKHCACAHQCAST